MVVTAAESLLLVVQTVQRAVADIQYQAVGFEISSSRQSVDEFFLWLGLQLLQAPKS